MTKNKKLLLGIGIVALIAIVSVGIYKNHQKESDDSVIRIGVILPLSGDWGQFGERMLNGIKLWQDEHPNARVKLYVEDGKGNAQKSITAFSKLVNLDRINACISGVSPVILGIAPLADKAHVFTVNAGATSPEIKKITPYMFTIIPDAEVEARYIARYVSKQLKFRECYVLWKNDDSGLGMLKCFSDEFSKLGGSVIGSDSILSIDSIKDSLAKIKNARVKAVFIPTNGEMMARIIKHAYSMGLRDIQWIGYAATESPELKKELGDINDVKLIFSSYAFNANRAFSGKSERFITSYRQRFSEIPAYYSATCYDAIDLIFSASSAEGSDLLEKIKSISQFQGVSGDFTIAGNHVNSGMTMKMLQNGDIVNVD